MKPVSCFAGTRLEAFEAVGRKTEIAAVATVRDSWVHKRCVERGISVYVVDKARRQEAFDFLKAAPGTLVISAGFPFIIPGETLRCGKLFVNSHPSLLPAYKGRDAIREAHRAGEQAMGVTFHVMAEEVDAGPLLWQESVPVSGLPLENIYDLLFREVEPRVVERGLEMLAASGWKVV